MHRLVRLVAMVGALAVAGGCGSDPAGGDDVFRLPAPAAPESPEMVRARDVLLVHGKIFREIGQTLIATRQMTPEVDALLSAVLADGPLRSRVRAGARTQLRRGLPKVLDNPRAIYFLPVDVQQEREDCMLVITYTDIGLFRVPNERPNVTRIDMIRTIQLRLVPLDPADDPLGINSSGWQIQEAVRWDYDNDIDPDGVVLTC